MAHVRCLLIVLLSAVALALLWPTGHLGQSQLGAIALGLPVEAFTAFIEASPQSPVPRAPLLLLAACAFAGYRDRQRGVSSPSEPGSWLGTVITFGACWVISSLLLRGVGAPFITGDSPTYLRQSLNPRDALGSHHPSTTAWMLYAGRALSIPVGASLALVSAAQFMVLLTFFRTICGRSVALLATVAVFALPDLLLTDLSLWSEQLFFLFLFSLTLIVQSARFGARELVLAVICFVAIAESRHAAIFLLPGLALGVARAMAPGTSLKSLFRSVVVAASCLGGAWLTLNFVRTGNPTAPTLRSFECAQFITAYHVLPICELDAAKELCAMDPNRQFLRPVNEGESEWIKADHFIFRKDSPLNQLGYSQQQVCELWHRISASLFRERPGDVAKLILRRMAAQFGPWEFSERGEPSALPLFKIDGEVSVDTITIGSNPTVAYILWGVWVIGLAAALRRKTLFDPVVIFLVLGALAHAFGIAINNPFRAMRYMLVPKSMLLIASLYAIIIWARTRNRSAGSGV